MIGYFLLIILCIGAWGLLYVGDKKDKDAAAVVGIVLSIVSTTLLIIATITLGTKNSDAETFQNNRDYYQELVNSISDNMSPATVAKIISSAEHANTKIENNRRYCNSEMWGFIYSKKVAAVELIKIPKYKFSVEVEE